MEVYAQGAAPCCLLERYCLALLCRPNNLTLNAVAARAQVEDMLKRSFAEFHAQRAAPEAREALAAGEAALAALCARPWPASRRGTPRAEVERYWALTQRVEALDALLQVCGLPAGQIG